MVTKQGRHTFQYIHEKYPFFAFHALHSSKREKTFKIINALIPMSMKRR